MRGGSVATPRRMEGGGIRGAVTQRPAHSGTAAVLRIQEYVTARVGYTRSMDLMVLVGMSATEAEISGICCTKRRQRRTKALAPGKGPQEGVERRTYTCRVVLCPAYQSW